MNFSFSRREGYSICSLVTGVQSCALPVSVASIFAWTRGLHYRSSCDDTPGVVDFAATRERVCIETVEAGHMTKDLAILIGPDHAFLNTRSFFHKIDENLKAALGK